MQWDTKTKNYLCADFQGIWPLSKSWKSDICKIKCRFGIIFFAKRITIMLLNTCQVFIFVQDHLHFFLHFVFSFMEHLFYECPHINTCLHDILTNEGFPFHIIIRHHCIILHLQLLASFFANLMIFFILWLLHLPTSDDNIETGVITIDMEEKKYSAFSVQPREYWRFSLSLLRFFVCRRKKKRKKEMKERKIEKEKNERK